jgi:hypothetical protein
VSAAERDAIVALRIALETYLRVCGGCGGSGKLPSHRDCPICRRGRAAIANSEQLLREERDVAAQALSIEHQAPRV